MSRGIKRKQAQQMSDHERREVHFTIDGKPFESKDDDQEAASLLRLAGLDPAAYDIARIKKNGENKVFKDSHVINIKDGDTFVSVRQVAEVG